MGRGFYNIFIVISRRYQNMPVADWVFIEKRYHLSILVYPPRPLLTLHDPAEYAFMHIPTQIHIVPEII
jgi:hypothetical protein